MALKYSIEKLGSQFLKINTYSEDDILIKSVVLMNPSIVVEPTPEDDENSIRITTANKQYDIPIFNLNIFGAPGIATVLDVINFFYNSYD